METPQSVERDGKPRQIRAIEYHMTDGKWFPFSVVTSSDTYDFDYSKSHGLLYHSSGSGSKHYLLHRFTKPKTLPGKLWVAPGVKLVRYKIKRDAERTIEEVEVPRDPTALAKMGYALLDKPLALEDGLNPFNNATEGEPIWCELCKDFLLYEDDDPCEHLEWCKRCGSFVYVARHVPHDRGLRGKPVIHEEQNVHDRVGAR
jgi:hypothetical protein